MPEATQDEVRQFGTEQVVSLIKELLDNGTFTYKYDVEGDLHQWGVRHQGSVEELHEAISEDIALQHRLETLTVSHNGDLVEEIREIREELLTQARTLRDQQNQTRYGQGKAGGLTDACGALMEVLNEVEDGDEYIPRITEDLVFYSAAQDIEFDVRNVWVHEDGSTYVRYAGEGKFLCDTAEEVREKFEDGDWEVIRE